MYPIDCKHHKLDMHVTNKDKRQQFGTEANLSSFLCQ